MAKIDLNYILNEFIDNHRKQVLKKLNLNYNEACCVCHMLHRINVDISKLDGNNDANVICDVVKLQNSNINKSTYKDSEVYFDGVGFYGGTIILEDDFSIECEWIMKDIYNKVRKELRCSALKKLVELVEWENKIRVKFGRDLKSGIFTTSINNNLFLTQGQIFRKYIENFI